MYEHQKPAADSHQLTFIYGLACDTRHFRLSLPPDPDTVPLPPHHPCCRKSDNTASTLETRVVAKFPLTYCLSALEWSLWNGEQPVFAHSDAPVWIPVDPAFFRPYLGIRYKHLNLLLPA